MSNIVPASHDSTLVGAKAASLTRLATVSDIRVPPYFVVATSAFDAVVASSRSIVRDLESEPVASSAISPLAEAIREDIRTAALPADLAIDIAEAYRALSRRSGEEESFVSVRSSATAEDGAKASFAGQYTTCLNIQGVEALLGAVRRVWASTFSEQAVRYRKQHKGPGLPVSMAVIVQRMVDAASAGTIYTVDPETGVPMICINAVPGLGIADVAGTCTPTSWLIDPGTMTVVKQRKSSSIDGPIGADTLLELARQVARIGAHFRQRFGASSLELEYVIDRAGGISFTQVRPETVWSRGKAQLSAVDLDRAAHIPLIFQGGMSGCPGVASGMLRVARSLAEAEAIVQVGDILVTPNTANVWEHLFGKIGGIVTEIGGTGSHTAVVMRELGKPALVGASHAMQSLAAYHGQPVTLDATQRLVFAGTQAAAITHQLTTVAPAYGGADQQSADAAWAEAASQPGRVLTDAAGRRWITKPEYPVRLFTQSVLLDAHRWIGKRLDVPVASSIQAGVHQIAFSDVMKWRRRLRRFDLENLERLEQERESAMAEYLDACALFELRDSSIRKWLRRYTKMNAFIGLGFIIYKVTEGLLEEVLAKARIVEPYYTQIRRARVGLEESESSRAARHLRGLVAQAHGDTGLAAAITASREAQPDTPLRASEYEDFYRRLVDHARSFKVTPVAEIDLPERDAVLSVVRAVHDLMASSPSPLAAKEPFVSNEDVQFFPGDDYFRRVHRLALAAEKARQDSHHLRVRGHWLIRGDLERLAAHLVRQGRIGSFAALFDHSPNWLLEQVNDKS